MTITVDLERVTSFSEILPLGEIKALALLEALSEAEIEQLIGDATTLLIAATHVKRERRKGNGGDDAA